MRAMNRIATALLTLILTACATSGGGTALEGSFLSTQVTEHGQDRPLVDGTRIRLGFDDGQLSANAGCNIFGGSYRLEGDRLIVEGGSMTEMGCDEERSAQDEWLFGLLGSQPTLSQDGDELVLTADDTVITLIDEEVAEPDVPLVGTTWTVESLITGDAVSSVPAGAVATFEFAEDGEVAVNTGCNQGGGRFTVDGDRLTFADVAVTEMACEGPGGELEAAVLPILGADGLTFAIDSNTLTVMAGNQGLILRGS